MASIYKRKTSAYFYIRKKNERGEWVSESTGYRKDNPGDRRQAELLARKLTEEERTRRPHGHGAAFEEWVERWLHERYGRRSNLTLKVYSRHWRLVSGWLQSENITSPNQLRYAHLPRYRDARSEQGASINTIIQEVKLLGLVMQEAVRREFAESNPCVRLGWEREKPKEKQPWTDEEFKRVRAKLEETGPAWMLATLILGFYQAARLRQCAVPLSDLDLRNGYITYRRTKGDKPFTQPLDRHAIPYLQRIATARERDGKKTLCDIPLLPSVEWRRFLDEMGLQNLSHHGLRVTWITRAALSGRDGRRGVSVAEAKRFVNHGSTAVHELYQKLNANDLTHVPAALDLPG